MSHHWMTRCFSLGNQPGADLGPLISPQAKERVCELVQSGVDEGAKVIMNY
jgi:malonate-semialdehyde dehydrogenase (acetylating)/methylmalonate-semialdehyde dehydrogenase